MSLRELIQVIVSKQKETNKSIPVDIILNNGNILLRSFKIKEFDTIKEVVTGITLQEEYIHVREGRAPVLCSLHLNELKELEVADLDFDISETENTFYA